MLDDQLIHELTSLNGNKLASATAAAAQKATEAAALAQELVNANEAVKTALKLRDEALEKQTSLVEQIQQKLRSSILTEMEDTRLVQILDASDRMVTLTTTSSTNMVDQILDDKNVVVTVNVVNNKTTQAPEPTKAYNDEVLYPTDWVVIGSLIFVILFVSLIVCYSRSQER
ncbi:Uncharacterized protein SCF082_LOCUS24910 [Durusdinium trenchii]|uniref:Uncharacterized protein n=1 Tax=Durusdinium trenchii TaxID=1381693 RepID=A0ABP0LXJ7_9DINO